MYKWRAFPCVLILAGVIVAEAPVFDEEMFQNIVGGLERVVLGCAAIPENAIAAIFGRVIVGDEFVDGVLSGLRSGL